MKLIGIWQRLGWHSVALAHVSRFECQEILNFGSDILIEISQDMSSVIPSREVHGQEHLNLLSELLTHRICSYKSTSTVNGRGVGILLQDISRTE